MEDAHDIGPTSSTGARRLCKEKKHDCRPSGALSFPSQRAREAKNTPELRLTETVGLFERRSSRCCRYWLDDTALLFPQRFQIGQVLLPAGGALVPDVVIPSQEKYRNIAIEPSGFP